MTIDAIGGGVPDHPGARFFDHDLIAKVDSIAAHVVESPADAETEVKQLSISEQTTFMTNLRDLQLDFVRSFPTPSRYLDPTEKVDRSGDERASLVTERPGNSGGKGAAPVAWF
jgi:hypothetical protein